MNALMATTAWLRPYEGEYGIRAMGAISNGNNYDSISISQSMS